MFIVGVVYEGNKPYVETTCPSVRPSVTQYQDQTVDRTVIKFKSSLQKL
jgi:hypothetical protein